MDNVAELCEVKKQQHRSGCEKGEDEKNPDSGNVHLQLKIQLCATGDHPKTQTRSPKLRVQ